MHYFIAVYRSPGQKFLRFGFHQLPFGVAIRVKKVLIWSNYSKVIVASHNLLL